MGGLWIFLFLYIASQIGTSAVPRTAATLPETAAPRITRAPTSPSTVKSSTTTITASKSPRQTLPKGASAQAQQELLIAQDRIRRLEQELHEAQLRNDASLSRAPVPSSAANPWDRVKRTPTSAAAPATHRPRAAAVAALAVPVATVAGAQCGLSEPACGNDEELFLTYTQGGGFNNQRQSIERAFQLALLLNRTLVVRDVWVDAKHNPGVNSTLDKPLFLPFDLFFDWTKLVRGVPTVTEADMLRLRPGVWQKRTVMRGIFAGDKHWVDTVPCDLTREPVLSITGEERLPATSLYGVLEQLGCNAAPVLEIGLIGMNRFWRTSEQLRRAAWQSVALAPSVHAHAKELWLELLRNRIDSRTARPQLVARDSFVCVHYRQGDKVQQSPKEYNYTAQLVVDILKAKRLVLPGELVYVATDLAAEQFELLAPFVDAFDARMLARHFAPLVAKWHVPSNDYVANVEVELCAMARLFFASSSTMSASILNTRHQITGITEWEIDPTSNFKLTRITRDWKAQHP